MQRRRMGWSHPDISLKDLLNLIKGFVDIIILTSGYQSSGLPATWDVQNMKKALQWGLFFENVFKSLSFSDDYQGSLKELDAALFEITSNPHFPQGLAHLSSATLTRARDFVLSHLIHTLPLKDAHLSALLTAAVEMDLDDLRRTEYDCLNVYLEKLMLQNGSDSQSSQNVPDIKIKEHASSSHSEFIIQELSKRHTEVSCVSSVEKGLDILSESVTRRMLDGSDSIIFDGQTSNGNTLLSEEQMLKFAAWNQWRSRSLSYLLDKRTVKLVSGAKLIFSAPKVQWLQVFERLKGPTEVHDDTSLEIIELSLLGCISSRWNHLIEHFMSVSYGPLPISKQYHEVCNLLHRRSQFLHSKEEPSKENDIIGYLTVVLSNQLHQLWKLSPVLPALAIPFWSPLFRCYLSEIETKYKGDLPVIRCCSCTQEGKEHEVCELAERIWCLHVFHIQGSHLTGSSDSA